AAGDYVAGELARLLLGLLQIQALEMWRRSPPPASSGSVESSAMIRQTKIVATIGPASSDESMLRELMKAGVNVCRLNFSHGTHDDHEKVLTRIRALEAELARPVAIL